MFNKYIRKDCKDIVATLMNYEDVSGDESPGKDYRVMNKKEYALCSARAGAIVSTINLREKDKMKENIKKALDEAYKKNYK